MKISLKYNIILVNDDNLPIHFDKELEESIKKLNEPTSEIHQYVDEDIDDLNILSSEIQFEIDFENKLLYLIINYILDENVSNKKLNQLLKSTSDQLTDGYGEGIWEIELKVTTLYIEFDDTADYIYPVEIKKEELKLEKNCFNCDKKIEKAVKNGNIKLVLNYLKNGGDINCIGKWEQSLLMKAIQSNQEEMAFLLIENGVDINRVDDEGGTALYNTAFFGLTKTAKLLIEKGADINAVDRNGWTTLMMASNRKQLELVKLLVELGADVTIKNEYGHNALDTTDREIFVYLKEIKSKQEMN